MKGNLVKTIYEGMAEKDMQQNAELKTGTIPAGMYIIRMQTAGGVMQKKIIIKR